MPDTDPAERTGNCRLCARRDYLRPHVCDPCRSRLRHRLSDLFELWTQLAYPEGDLAPDNRTVTVDSITRPADPVAGVIPAAPVRAPSAQPRVSGTRDKQLPIDVTRADLLAPVVRIGGIPVDKVTTQAIPLMETVTVIENVVIEGVSHPIPIRRRRPVLDSSGHPIVVIPDDQVGRVSVAQMLDQWVRAWMDERYAGENRRPEPTVPALLFWLLDRLDWAYDHYTPIADFADEVHSTLTQLRTVLDCHEPRPILCAGVECGHCRRRNCLYIPVADPYVECAGCGALYSLTEYGELVKEQHANLRRDPTDAP
jgi:hypothetical protein